MYLSSSLTFVINKYNIFNLQRLNIIREIQLLKHSQHIGQLRKRVQSTAEPSRFSFSPPVPENTSYRASIQELSLPPK